MKRNVGFQVRWGNLYVVFLPARFCAEHIDFGSCRSMAELGIANTEFTREPKPFEKGPVFRGDYGVGPQCDGAFERRPISRNDEPQKVKLLELGADDYVVKPFGMAELLARVRVALRRQMRAASGEPTVRAGALTIDLSTRTVTLNGARLTLTPKEYRLLQVLAQHAGNVVTHQHLLKEVWGSVHVQDTHYLRIFMRKLRQKIEPEPNSPKILLTELGVGYRLAQSGEVEPAPNGAIGARAG